jgi:dolichol-phosphate mannosyltransferase
MTGAAELAYRISAAARHPRNWVQLFKFGLVGGSGYLINLAVFAVLAGPLGIYHLAAAVGAFVVAVGSNFFWNRRWTFGSGDGPAGFQAARFFTVSIAGLVINLILLEALLATDTVGELASQAIAVALVMPFNFVCNRIWTFA